MRIDILTLFPGMFRGPFDESIIKRALDAGVAEIHTHDIRDWAEGNHSVCDDYPYGGGPGMVLKPEPVFAALKAFLSDEEILELTYITCLYDMHAVMSRALRTEFDDRDDPIVEVAAPKDFSGADFLDIGRR